jgi:hypothetical protein
MAAPPNVTTEEAQTFLNVVADMAGPPSVRASRSHRYYYVSRKSLHQIKPEAELDEHEGFHARCAGGGPGAEEAGVPLWFGMAMKAALAAALQPIHAQLNNLENNIGARM